MIYQLRDKKQINIRNKIRKNFIIFILVFVLVTLGMLSFMSSSVYSLGGIFWRARDSVHTGVYNMSYLLNSKKALLKENVDLKNKNKILESQFINYETLVKENDELKSLWNRTSIVKSFVLANILVKPSHTPYDTIVIDVGSDEGIEEGDKVYANSNISIGRVSSVYKDNSLVILYSNPNEVTYVMFENSHTNVDLVGRGGGNFEVNVPSDLPVSIGEKVFIPSDTIEAVAIVDDNISKANDPIKKIILHAPINVQNLKWVQVKTN